MQGYPIECERCAAAFTLCRPCYRNTKYCKPCQTPSRIERVRGYREKYAASRGARLIRVERNARARKKAASNETDPGLTFTRAPAHRDAHGDERADEERDDELDLGGPERAEEAQPRDARSEQDEGVDPILSRS